MTPEPPSIRYVGLDLSRAVKVAHTDRVGGDRISHVVPIKLWYDGTSTGNWMMTAYCLKNRVLVDIVLTKCFFVSQSLGKV